MDSRAGAGLDETGLPLGSGSIWEVFKSALRLGLTSFGGPIAHLGYFRHEYVVRRRWLDEKTYADLVGLCQFLPGPTSSEVGIAVGMTQAGFLGGLAGWVGFTLPSAMAMTIFGLAVRHAGSADLVWLHGLKVVAVAVVAQAVWTMARTLTPDFSRIVLALLATATVLAWSSGLAPVATIALGGLLGRYLPAPLNGDGERLDNRFSRIGARPACFCGGAFAILLVGLPVAHAVFPGHALDLLNSFYRAGALVFGGGHVVLPLLQSAVVPPGWLSNNQFLAGYGAAQAVPGPLFTFAAYLGAVQQPTPNGVPGAMLALLAIFLPAYLLVGFALPFWNILRRRSDFRAALRGVNAVVVGILLAALIHPVWTSAITSLWDALLAVTSLVLLLVGKAPPWPVVVFGVVGGIVIKFIA